MCGKIFITAAAMVVVLAAGKQFVLGAQAQAADGGVVSGVVTALGDNWVEVGQAGQASQRYLLPPVGEAKPGATNVARLGTALHAAVGSDVDLLWQTVDGKATAVGMIAKAGTTVGKNSAIAGDEGGTVYVEAVGRTAGESEAASEYAVASPWPTGAQENLDPLDANWGSFYGFVTGKSGGESIDVCPVGDDNAVSVRFAPAQVRPATARDNGLDLRVQEQIRIVPVGARVEVFWIYADGKRAVRIVPATQNGVIAPQ